MTDKSTTTGQATTTETRATTEMSATTLNDESSPASDTSPSSDTSPASATSCSSTAGDGSGPRRRGRLVAFVAAAVVVAAGVFGAGVLVGAAQEETLLLAGPTANIVVTIPDGWHQTVNSANPLIPQMVAPVDCLGRGEVGCATGLARVATILAPTAADAVRSVSQVLTSEGGVTRGPTLGEGPGPVGAGEGYRQRFTFRNPRAEITAEVAAVPSGSVVPDAQGNREFSIVLAWVSDQPGAPPVATIDEIVDSAQVRGGQPG